MIGRREATHIGEGVSSIKGKVGKEERVLRDWVVFEMDTHNRGDCVGEITGPKPGRKGGGHPYMVCKRTHNYELRGRDL